MHIPSGVQVCVLQKCSTELRLLKKMPSARDGFEYYTQKIVRFMKSGGKRARTGEHADPKF